MATPDMTGNIIQQQEYPQPQPAYYEGQTQAYPPQSSAYPPQPQPPQAYPPQQPQMMTMGMETGMTMNVSS